MVHPKVQQLPPGWRIIDSRVTGRNEWCILCERTEADDGTRGTKYVTWRTEGIGCYLGHYTDDERKAIADFNNR